MNNKETAKLKDSGRSLSVCVSLAHAHGFAETKITSISAKYFLQCQDVAGVEASVSHRKFQQKGNYEGFGIY